MEIIKHKKEAILFGATGLVGGYCLEELLQHEGYSIVRSFGRRKVAIQHPKLRQYLIDFEELDQYQDLIQGNDLFLCLGTTRAKAGKYGFVKVDFEYAFTIAKLAALNEANQLMLVSSVTADKDSYFLYSKTKGALEDAVSKLPFWSVHIFQPSFLLGNRTETRLTEQLGTNISLLVERLTRRSLKKYSPVDAASVAKAMIKAAQQIQGGVYRYPSHEIQVMAQETMLLG